MSNVNPQIHSWFDMSAIEGAILGDDEYFLPSVTFHDYHDRLLVLSQLGMWANSRDSHQRAREAVLNAIREACRRRDLRTAFDIVWTTLIIDEEYTEPLGVNFFRIRKELQELLRNQPSDLIGDEELSILVSRVRARVPGLL